MFPFFSFSFEGAICLADLLFELLCLFFSLFGEIIVQFCERSFFFELLLEQFFLIFFELFVELFHDICMFFFFGCELVFEV